MKKLLSLILVLMMILPATACTSSTKKSSKTSKNDFTVEKITNYVPPTTEKPKKSKVESDNDDVSMSETDSDKDESSKSSDGYIFPDSDSKLIDGKEINPDRIAKTLAQYGRDEILARHGVIFNDSQTQSYFESKDWYKGTVQQDDFSLESLNEIEYQNFNIIDYCITLNYSNDSSGSKSNAKSNNNNNNNNNGGNKCTACGGWGRCYECGGNGLCVQCNGTRNRVCMSCSGGTCGACGGSGTMYKYIGLDMKKVPCDTCHGKRTCQVCGGDMKIPCGYCNGSGNCYTCKGSGDCIVCFGNGYR